MKIKDHLFTISFVLSLTVFVTTLQNQLSEEEPEYVQIEVKPGDTIWDYAEQFKEHHRLSKADFVEWVTENNFLFDGKLKAGETIILPIESQTVAIAE